MTDSEDSASREGAGSSREALLSTVLPLVTKGHEQRERDVSKPPPAQQLARQSPRGVAKSQLSPQGSDFEKWISCPDTLSSEFTPSNILAWFLLRCEKRMHTLSADPVDPSFRALSGRLKFTVRRHKFIKNSFSRRWGAAGGRCRAELLAVPPLSDPAA